jgi:hypothetical protein
MKSFKKLSREKKGMGTKRIRWMEQTYWSQRQWNKRQNRLQGAEKKKLDGTKTHLGKKLE